MTIKQAAQELGLSERELRSALPGDEDVATLEDQLFQVEGEIEATDSGVCYLTGAQIDALHEKKKKGIEARLDKAYEEMAQEDPCDLAERHNDERQAADAQG